MSRLTDPRRAARTALGVMALAIPAIFGSVLVLWALGITLPLRFLVIGLGLIWVAFIGVLAVVGTRRHDRAKAITGILLTVAVALPTAYSTVIAAGGPALPWGGDLTTAAALGAGILLALSTKRPPWSRYARARRRAS